MELIWLNDNVAALTMTPQLALPQLMQAHQLLALLQLQPTATVNAAVAELQLPLPECLTPDEQLLQTLAQLLPQAHSFVAQQLQLGHKLLLTAADAGLLGIMMAELLMSDGAAPVHAVAQVRSLYEDAFADDGWDQFVFDVLYRLQG
ncbi:protein phosphatase [Shewanella dokdonensis]|uniref:Protein phosphatase n=1 Tax=Shewanella dokdonensis TaxID=712036 RepID=A0ABX8DIE9_9GAMM|nr:protein phosphatase [Shewanella dokdonensis]MCL1075212.1 protein phosphatase [Shewanella dokdonensis]QVK23587.1 protein phosphatase [Shewanella dokdonensis]